MLMATYLYFLVAKIAGEYRTILDVIEQRMNRQNVNILITSRENGNSMKANIRTKLVNKYQRVRDIIWPGRAMVNLFRSLLFHRQKQLSAIPDTAVCNSSGTEQDRDLIRRIAGAYQRAKKAELGNSMWKVIFASYQQPIHQALINGNEGTTTEIFRNPKTSDLFYGFDILTRSSQDAFSKKTVREAYAKLCLDGLVR